MGPWPGLVSPSSPRGRLAAGAEDLLCLGRKLGGGTHSSPSGWSPSNGAVSLGSTLLVSLRLPLGWGPWASPKAKSIEEGGRSHPLGSPQGLQLASLRCLFPPAWMLWYQGKADGKLVSAWPGEAWGAGGAALHWHTMNERAVSAPVSGFLSGLPGEGGILWVSFLWLDSESFRPGTVVWQHRPVPLTPAGGAGVPEAAVEEDGGAARDAGVPAAEP